MNEHTGELSPSAGEPYADGEATAFRFTGTWTEYLPVAATNLLLTIVTLGIYRFWATARTRRYLWSRTRFIDDPLEWTGTGLEMFIGFLIVMLFLVPFLLFFQFGFQAMVLRGEGVAAGLLLAGFYLGFLYLYGLATFRALRYRLSRTFWRGIRGGSDDAGWSYGWSSMWKTIVGALVFGLLIPWSMTRLWNERWGKMSFGPHRFSAHADTTGLMGRFLLIYALPIAGVFTLGFFIGGVFKYGTINPNNPGNFFLIALVPIALYLLVLLAGIAYYAKFYRQALAATKLGPVDLAFTARTADWFRLIGGTIALVVLTLGLGLLFVSYRNWSFFIRHLEAYGEIDLDGTTQSTARGATDAEGLAAAFDIGAI